MTGYAHPGYGESLAEFGIPQTLPRSGGCILVRPIPDTDYKDGMGSYPLFFCRDWSCLRADLEELDGLVSLSVATDPFGEYDAAALRDCFGDVVKPFKEHHVADLRLPIEEIAGARHRKNARKALREVEVTACEEPVRFLDEWTALYGNLIERHNISGVRAFSREAFVRQLSIPGTHLLRAVCNGDTVGAQIYFQQGDVVHCHLGAVSAKGYSVGAFHAMDYVSIGYFADKARWLNLGGGAGALSDGSDGLSMYKKGWSTETRTSYFCGRIFDRDTYGEIVKGKAVHSTDYFPVYRKGEFG